MSALRGYAASISRYTGATAAADLDEIEDFMRLEYRTLDHLSPEQFARCARECWRSVQWSRTPEGLAYVAALEAEYGLGQ